MSNNWICIIPKDPYWIPSDETQQYIKSTLRQIMPESENIDIEVDDTIQFRDCGSNFETINCPKCGVELSIQQWQSKMDQDYHSNGFVLSLHKMDCCGNEYTLNQLIYYFNQGFSRAIASCMNPNKGELTSLEIQKIQDAFGVQILVIYQHI